MRLPVFEIIEDTLLVVLTMRDHGWQLPFHPLQVAVIAVFSSLTFAFYVFLIPFLGSKVLEYHIVGIFSPLAIVVFVLYIRCAAINPADPGVRCSEAYQKPSTSTKTEPVEDVAFDSQRPETKSLGTVIYPESHKRPSGSASGARVNRETGNKIMKASCLSFQCFQSTFHCACGGKTRPRPVAQEDLLYCSLCRREISKYSKHCRACDKCVQGFDHHCRWINNCIGRRNYRSFFGLMITSLILLIMHWAIGIFVAVRCLMDREDFKGQIVSKLGSRFSLIPFIVVVAICTTVALLATFPLGQLFFFHIILIHKGMSTYDYIVAMREVELCESADGDEESLQLSPTTSVATSISSYADGTQKKPEPFPSEILVQQGALVTSARHQPVTVTEVRGKAVTASQQEASRKKKQPIRISPWKLAQLNAVEASRAATRARERSTTFIPIGTENSIVTETDSSLDSSTKSHAEIGPVSGSKKLKSQKEFPHSFFRDQFPLTKIYNNREIQASSIDHVHRNASSCDKAITPLQMEARSVFRPGLPVTNSRFSASPVRNDPSTRDVHSRIQLTTPARSLQDFFSEVYPSEPTNSWVPHSTSDGYEASGGESADDSELALKLSLNSNNLKSYATRKISDVPAKWNNKSEEKSNAINSKHEFNAMISSPSQFISPSRDSNFSSSGIISIPFNTKTRGIRGTSSGSVGHEDAFFSVDSRSTSMRSLQSPT